MHIRTIIALSCAISLNACNSYFDPENIDVTERPVMYCIPSPGNEAVIIQLSKSVPVTASGLPPRGLPGANISFRLNGKPMEAVWNQNVTPRLPAECYYVPVRVNEGDEIDLSAEMTSFNIMSSHTKIPAAFPLEDIELVLRPGIEEKLQFRITFRDNATTDDFYGVRIVNERINEIQQNTGSGNWTTVDQSVEYSQAIRPDLTEEPLLNNKVGLDATFDLDYNYYNNLYIWSDDKIAGKRYTMQLSTAYNRVQYATEGDIRTLSYDSYVVYLYRLSHELYRYLKSVNDIANNELGQNGLAPVRSQYSNVINGLGIVGGCNVTQSERLVYLQ